MTSSWESQCIHLRSQDVLIPEIFICCFQNAQLTVLCSSTLLPSTDQRGWGFPKGLGELLLHPKGAWLDSLWCPWCSTYQQEGAGQEGNDRSKEIKKLHLLCTPGYNVNNCATTNTFSFIFALGIQKILIFIFYFIWGVYNESLCTYI